MRSVMICSDVGSIDRVVDRTPCSHPASLFVGVHEHTATATTPVQYDAMNCTLCGLYQRGLGCALYHLVTTFP